MKKIYMIPSLRVAESVVVTMYNASTDPENPSPGGDGKGTSGTGGGPDAKRFYQSMSDSWDE